MRLSRYIHLMAMSGLILLFLLAAMPAHARGRGGFGGASRGDFGGFSRSSPASNGNWQSNRSNMQSSRQSWSSQNQQNRQDWSSQNQQNRQNWSSQNQQNRQDWSSQNQRNRQNYASNYDDYHYRYGGYYHPPSYGYYHPPPNYNAGAFAAGAITGAAIGTAISASQFNSMSAQATPVVIGSTTYYQVGTTYYKPVYQGGGVTYVVVQPPQ